MTSFPAAWDLRQLGDVVDVLDSRRIPVSAMERADRVGDVPYYGATGQVGTIDGALFDEPLVLLGEDGVQFFDPNKPKSYLIDGPAWVNNHAHVLRAKDAIGRRFLNYYLNSADYRGFANGTTRLKLTQAAMRRIPVPVPSVDEQRRIVDILEDHLSRLEVATEQLRLAQRRLDTFRISALAHTNDPQRDWIASPISELLHMSIGGLWGTAPGTSEVDVRVIRVTEMKAWGRLDPSTAATRSISRRQFESRRLRSGDLLLEKSGGGPKSPVGRVGLVADPEESSICANFMQLMRPNRSLVLPEYLHMTLNSFHLTGGTTSMQTASTNIRNIRASEYLATEIAVPGLPEQRKLVESVDESLNAASRLEKDIVASRNRGEGLRRALSAAAFTGQLTGKSSDLDRAEEALG